MLEWFRKNQRVMLVVFVSLLMVVFLLPSGGRWLQPDPEAQVIGTAGGRAVTLGDQRRATHELELLRRMPQGISNDLPEDGLTWHLLMIEARDNGIHTSMEEAQQIRQQLLSMGVPLGQMLGRGMQDESFLDAALQHLGMYMQMRNMAVGSVASEPRLRHFAMDIRSRAAVDLLAVDAAYLFDQAGEPAEDQIKEQYEKLKSARPGTSPPYGFGYFQPARIKLEYLKIPLKRLAASITVDEIQASRYYQDHPERFIKPVPPEDPAKKDEAKKEEPKKPATPEIQPYKEVRQRIISDLTDQQARDLRDKVAKWAVAQLTEQIRRLPATKDGYIDLPAGFQPMALDDLARQAQAEFKILPDVVRNDRWIRPSEVETIEDLGSAVLALTEQQQYPLAAYLASARELTPPTANPLVAQRLQINIPSRIIEDGEGNAYLLRITAASPAHEPRNLDEVRSQILTDLKRVRSFELLKQRADTLLARARTEGLDKLAQSVKSKVVKVPSFSGRDIAAVFSGGKLEAPQIPGIGKSDAFVNAVFELGRRIQDAGGIPKAKPEDLILAIPVETTQSLAIIKLTDYSPINSAEYDGIKNRLPQLIMANVVQLDRNTSPFTPDNVARRLGYKEDTTTPRRAPADQAPIHPLDLAPDL